MNTKRVGLVADIGATNARFSLVNASGQLSPPRVYALKDYRSLADALDAYLAHESPADAPDRGVLAVAAPVTGDQVRMTNHTWGFSIEEIRRRYRLRRLRVINDFAANALAIPRLDARDRTQIGAGAPVADAPIGVIGPGTGLGVSALIHTETGPVVLDGEGGHVTMAAHDARESAVLDIVRQRFAHASAERVLSGPGIVNLYQALCALADVAPAPFTPAQITHPNVQDTQAREATAMFCAMLGTAAGNLALTLGARGGVYVAGGIAPRLGAAFAASAFRERFEAKGRFRGYLAHIPTYLITRPLPALLGAATLIRD